MEENLGNVERTLLAPEKLRTEKPFWKDLLSGFLTILLPMLVVGYMEAGLMEGAGFSKTVGWILTGVVTVILTLLMVWILRSRTAGFIRQRLEIRERGVSGVAVLNAFKTRGFSITYAELTGVNAGKNVLILAAGKDRVKLVLDEAEALAAELRQRKS